MPDARSELQETTRPHFAGVPESFFLMLGYEPSQVASEYELSDYSPCAHGMGMTPAEFLQQNPILHDGRDLP